MKDLGCQRRNLIFYIADGMESGKVFEQGIKIIRANQTLGENVETDRLDVRMLESLQR